MLSFCSWGIGPLFLPFNDLALLDSWNIGPLFPPFNDWLSLSWSFDASGPSSCQSLFGLFCHFALEGGSDPSSYPSSFGFVWSCSQGYAPCPSPYRFACPFALEASHTSSMIGFIWTWSHQHTHVCHLFHSDSDIRLCVGVGHLHEAFERFRQSQADSFVDIKGGKLSCLVAPATTQIHS